MSTTFDDCIAETTRATKTRAEIEAMTKAEAIACALVWCKWNDLAQGYRVIAFWARAHGENPRFVISMGIDNVGARKLLLKAHAIRKTSDMLNLLGSDWSDAWAT